MVSPSNPVARHPMVAFFVIAYLVAWGFWPVGSCGAFAPRVAALIVIPLSRGRAGLRAWGARLIRWRVRWIWYAFAVSVPLGVPLATAGLSPAVGGASAFAEATVWGVALTFALRMVNPTDGPLGEEPGWRGYAQPGLQGLGYSPLRSTAILAVLIAGWHLPLFFLEEGGPDPASMITGLVTTAAVTFWYAWLFNRSSGSVLLVVLAHAVEGSLQAEGWIYMAVWCAVPVTLLLVDRSAWRVAGAAAVDPVPLAHDRTDRPLAE